VDESYDDDVLEPLPVDEDGLPVPPAAVPRMWHDSFWVFTDDIRPSTSAGGRSSATFTRMTTLHPALLVELPNWWQRRADEARVRVTRQLVLEAPRFEASGTWRLHGWLRSPWLHRWIPVELELWPRLGAWTKLSLEPQRRVRPGSRYFATGNRVLDTLTARLTAELHAHAARTG
jgi:hypothetical protein